jgi:hypothetical protein
VAGGRPARRRAGGGEGIQASRQAGARIAIAVAGILLAATVAAWLSFSVTGSLRSITLLIVVPGLIVLAASLALSRPIGIPAAILLLGLAYTIRILSEEDTLDGRAPVVAVALFLTAELSYWALELRSTVAEEAGAYLRRIGLLAASALGVLVLGIALLALVEAVQSGGVAVDALGAAAAVATLAFLALASRRSA